MVSEARVGEALSQVAEKIIRLLIEHLQLMHAEAEREIQALTMRVKRIGIAVARAAPFLLAGVILVSFAAAQIAGLLLEPWLGRASTPIMTLCVGLAELLAAGHWLRSAFKDVSVGVEASPSNVRVLAAKSAVAREKSYGSVG